MTLCCFENIEVWAMGFKYEEFVNRHASNHL